MEGVAGWALTIGAVARTPLSLAGPAFFEFCQSTPERCGAVPLVVSSAIQVPIVETYPHSSLPEAVLHAQHGRKVLPELGGEA